VEGYEGEEDDEIEDFPGQEALLDGDDIGSDDEDDSSEDDGEPAVIHRKRGRPDSKFNLKKKEKEAKKKGKILVEVEHEDSGRRQKATL
nr:protein MAK16 homolog [Tanacetum cinerariifolium]